MGWFSKKSLFDIVTVISIFPKIGSAVLKIDKKLVVFSPIYLLGKHGQGSEQVGSKFLELKTALQLLKVLLNNLTSRKLTGDRVEIREVDTGIICGYDSLVDITPKLVKEIREEKVRGSNIFVIYTTKDKIPKTSLMNFILVKFNPEYGQGIELLFKNKYDGKIGFEDFEEVYAILTMFPGRYAPPFSDTTFWKKHALLKEIQ